MTNPTPFNCRNCQAPLCESAKFCSQCGQKNTDGKITFGRLMTELFGSLFNLESKIFRTLGSLFVPAKLTRAWFEGKHVRYYHPVRLFLVLAGIFIAAITFKSKDIFEEIKVGLDGKMPIYWKNKHRKEIDSLGQVLISKLPHPKANEMLDSLLTHFVAIPPEQIEIDTQLTLAGGLLKDTTIVRKEAVNQALADSISLENDITLTKYSFGKVAISDLLNLSEDELIRKYGIEGFWKQYDFRRRCRTIKAGNQIIYSLIGNILWMVFLMMPALALVLKILYIRHSFFYYEHLVFSFHTHSFLFLLLSLLILTGKSLPDWLTVIVFLFIPIWLILAMKRFYSQGFLKTIVKFLLTGISYIFIFLISGASTVFVSMLLV